MQNLGCTGIDRFSKLYSTLTYMKYKLNNKAQTMFTLLMDISSILLKVYHYTFKLNFKVLFLHTVKCCLDYNYIVYEAQKANLNAHIVN